MLSNIKKLIYGNKLLSSKKLEKFIQVVQSRNYTDIYEPFITHWIKPQNMVNLNNLAQEICPQKSYAFNFILNSINSSKKLNTIEKLSMHDIYAYLADDILVKVDRASMAYSLETRAPFLNHKLFQESWRMPSRLRIKYGKQKYPLIKILNEYLPQAYFQRPKKGFGVPIDYWLRGPLFNWAEELLDPISINKQGIFDAERITNTWKDFKLGNSKFYRYLWDILMFQAWLNKNY